MRPGYLYFVIFLWLVFTGGRFTAPFLKEIARFDDSLIGITIAVQSLLGSLLGSAAAVYADIFEQAYPNKGRICFLAGGILLGTLSFEMHSLFVFLADDNSTTYYTVLHILARILFSIFTAIIFPILDGVTLSYLQLKSEGNASSYGQERLFGAVSWAIASIMIGPAIDRLGFTVFFWTAPVAGVLCLATLFKYMIFVMSYKSHTTKDGHDKLHSEEDNSDDHGIEMTPSNNKQPDHEVSDESPACSGNTQSPDKQRIDETENMPEPRLDSEETNPNFVEALLLLKSMLASYTAFGFVICSFFLAMGMSVVESLIFLFFEQGLGSSNTLCGLTVLVTVVFEIPIFHYAPKLLERYGLEILQQIACLAYVTRVVGYTFVPKNHVALILLFEPLHGVTYACSKTSTVEFAAKVSPKGHEASGQGVLSLITGIGSVLGLSLGGWIEDALGPVTLYRSYAAIVAIGLITFFITSAVDKKRSKRYRQLRKQRSELCSEQGVTIP